MGLQEIGMIVAGGIVLGAVIWVANKISKGNATSKQ